MEKEKNGADESEREGMMGKSVGGEGGRRRGNGKGKGVSVQRERRGMLRVSTSSSGKGVGLVYMFTRYFTQYCRGKGSSE